MRTLLCTALILGLALPRASWAEEATPELPASESTGSPKDAPDVDPKAADTDVKIPEGDPEAKGKAASIKLTHEEPPHFLWGNFILGALGGGVLGAGAGFLLFTSSNKDGSIDYDKAKVIVPLSAAGGLVLGGVLSVLLGATTPTPPKPPEMNSSLGGASLALLPLQGGQALVFSASF